MPHPSTVFDCEWLSIREAADHAARSASLTGLLADWLARRDSTGDRLCDLGCGSGSNVRYLAPRLPTGQRWCLVDHDAGLLSQAAERCRSLPGVSSLETLEGDLVGSLDALIPEDTCLITASALLDLVSEQWLSRCVSLAARRGAACLITLSYSGDVSLTPALAEDDAVIQAVNAHQRQDKGGGPALGPDAWSVCASLFREAGFSVFHEPSVWSLDASQAALQDNLLTGWARAAGEWATESAPSVSAWLDQRLQRVRRGESRIRVGHRDLLALPPGSDTLGSDV
ncbi:class I SAM-dependent methyltransferase [Marinobacter sp. NFXS9]|uniref:class I SAM-dependent methyltransferase n=1 Tax=Marinobacter sp. NFXS9 TaxID=2818433 RepID=UPI0032DE798D